MKAITLLNQTNGSRFFELRPGDEFIEGPTIEVAHGVSDYAALDAVWAIGNRAQSDEAGNDWPSDVRSLSTGDAIGLEVSPGRFWWWAIEDIGFRALDRDPGLGAMPGCTCGANPAPWPAYSCPAADAHYERYRRPEDENEDTGAEA